MRTLKSIFAAFFVLTMAVGAIAQTDFLTAKEFKALMKSNPDLVIIDASSDEVYENAHVKKAISIPDYYLYQEENDIPGVIMPVAELEEFFGTYGVSNDSEIVIYDDGSQKYSTRVYWVLKYLGAPNVKIVHKNMDEWRQARIMLTSEAYEAPETSFTATIDESIIANMDYLKANIDNPGVVMIDNRTEAEFIGGDSEEAKGSKGHLPGAVHCDYKDLLDDNGAFLPADDLKARAVKLGVTPDKEVIFYCKTSVRGAVGWFVIKNILGYENAKLYDGAYVEWEASNAVEK